MNVLEICPWEPPSSGWTVRVKLLRRVIRERGGRCEILDIGPSRKLPRPDCIAVESGWDYCVKVVQFSRAGFTIHGHINAEYFRGLLLALFACLMARLYGNRCVVTFHGGSDQMHFKGWRRPFVAPFFWMIFTLAHAVVCNGNAEKATLQAFQEGGKIAPIAAFSKQYLEYEKVRLDPTVEQFIEKHSPLITTYICFRDGFYAEVLFRALRDLVKTWPSLGLVIVGTGDGVEETQRQIAAAQLTANVHIAGDFSHDAFMTLLAASDAHLRTPTTDGISATVLEALTLRIPVVTSENGNRPPSVITYTATDAQDLARQLSWTLTHRDEVVAAIKPPQIQDTAKTEVDLILGVAA